MKILSIQKSVLPSGQIVPYRQALSEAKPLPINKWLKYIHKLNQKK